MLSSDNRPGRKFSILRLLDISSKPEVGLLVVTFVLCFLGSLLVFKASSVGIASVFDPLYYFRRHAVGLIIGIGLFALLAITPYGVWRRMSLLLMATATLLLISTLLFGERTEGVRSLVLFGVPGLVNEFVKLVVVIYVAYWLSSKSGRLKDVSVGVVPFSVLLALVALLVVLQPDILTVTLLTATLLVMFLVAGAKVEHFALLSLIAAITFLVVVTQIDYASQSLSSVVSMLRQLTSSGDVRTSQSLESIARGGLFGSGFGQSMQNSRLSFSDNMIAVVGEEFGVIGIFAIILLFVAMTYYALRIASRSSDRFGLVLSCGLASLISFQFFLNLGVNVVSNPPSAIEAPFISYGASSLVGALAAVGLMTSVALHGRNPDRGTLSDAVLPLLPGLVIGTLSLIWFAWEGWTIDNILPTSPPVGAVSSELIARLVYGGGITFVVYLLFLFGSMMSMRIVMDRRSWPGEVHWREIVDHQLATKGSVNSRDIGESDTVLLGLYQAWNPELDLVLDELDNLRFRRLGLKKKGHKLWSEFYDISEKGLGISATQASQMLALVEEALEEEDIFRLTIKRQRFFVARMNTSGLFANLRFPLEIPVLVPEFADIREGDLFAIPRLVNEICPESQGIALLLTWSEAPLKSQTMLLRLRQVYAFDCCLVPRDTLEHLFVVRDPRTLLRRAVLRNVNLISISPFVTTGSTPTNMFFGREKELRGIVERARISNHAVIGGRRIGKTSLLRQLYHSRLPTAGFTAVYHDCSGLTDWDTAIGLLPQGRPLVLLLDEADKLVSSDQTKEWRVYNALRALTSSNEITIVLSGERILQAAMLDPLSPLFNFSEQIILGPLDQRAVEELVLQTMRQLEIDLDDEDGILEDIYNFTSGHPNVVQRLCNRIIGRLNEDNTRRITRQDLASVIEDPGFLRDDFLSTFWEAATPLEKLITLVMVDSPNARTLHGIQDALGERCMVSPSVRKIDDALQRLVDLRSLLKREPDGYEFAVKAFPRTVEGTMTLDDMIEIMIEDYHEFGA